MSTSNVTVTPAIYVLLSAANTYAIAVQKDSPVAVSDALVIQGD